MTEIKDSGERREFETGAQRDRAVGKGLPALISAPMMTAFIEDGHMDFADDYLIDAISGLYSILKTGKWGNALLIFKDLTTMKGYVEAIHRLSIQLEKGALKYSKRNWEKGMPLEEYINSALRHLNAMVNKQDDEDHYAAALFNVMGLWHTGYLVSLNALPAELNNLPGGVGYGN